jgi:hypothetical protein
MVRCTNRTDREIKLFEMTANLAQCQGPDSLNPRYKSCDEANRGEIATRQSVIARGDAPEVLQPVEWPRP